MDYNNLQIQTDERITVIKISRPETLNALNGEVIAELHKCFLEINTKGETDCVILTGSGRAFVAGADISAMANMKGEEGRDWTKDGMDLMNYIEGLKLPVIAAINGYALGGGCELALACDIRIASEKAKFAQPETGLGIIPGYGGTQRLSRLVGKGMAKYMIFTGEIIGGEDALKIGLVEKVVKHEELMEIAMKLARMIVVKAPIATRMAKRAINASENTDLIAGIDYELEAYDIAFHSEDRIEGMQAFLEKRKPIFKNS